MTDKIENSSSEVQQMLDAEFKRQVKRVAEHLHRFADRIDQWGDVSPYHRDGRSRHVLAAADVLSELRAMHGNAAMVEQMVVAAADAQREADKNRAAAVGGHQQ